MMIVLLAFLLMILFSLRIRIFNPDYISHATTTQINGIFVFLVFLSHFSGYFDSAISYSELYTTFQGFLGQLVVTTFLFYSGYGVCISIRKKGDDYVDQLPIKVVELLTSFVIVVLLFALVGAITQKDYDLSRILLSLIGWKSVGNSNWYMFDILLLYVLTYVAFKVTKKHAHALVVLLLLSLGAMVFLYTFQEGGRWYNTFLCYWLGVLYGFGKESYERLMFGHKGCYIATGIVLLAAFLLLHEQRSQPVFFILHALVFVLLVNHLSMIVAVNSPVLTWLGKRIFGIYLLQRIPMILGQYAGLARGGALTTSVYFVGSLLVTLLLAVGFHHMTAFLSKRIFAPLKGRAMSAKA